MNLVDLEFHLVEVPTIAGPPVRSLLVRLMTDRGMEGWGETLPIWRASELAARRDYLLPLLGDRQIFDLEELLTLEALASAPLRAAIDMACWDALGRELRQPLCRLWGGEYRPRIPAAARIPVQPANVSARLSREWIEHGYATLILTASGDLEDDLLALEIVRDAVGSRAALRVDAQAKYSFDQARQLLERCVAWGIPFVIDPLATVDFKPLAELERYVSPPLAVSQGISSPADVLAVSRSLRMPRVVVDLARVGGITAARKCAIVAEAAGIAVSCGIGSCLGIASAAVLHLAASTPHLSSAQEFSAHLTHDDILLDPLRVEDGMIAIPQGPGLGIEIDRSRVEQFAVRG